jgi:hypothetical protein
MDVGQLQSGSFQDFGDNCVSRVRKIPGFLPSSEQKGSKEFDNKLGLFSDWAWLGITR